MQLDATAHTGRPWRIHELLEDFDLADVWALPTPGGPGDLPRLARLIASSDESFLSNPVVRLLFAIRMRLGARLGLDTESEGAGAGGWSLRDRLPDDLRSGPRGPDVITLVPFPSVYLTDTEWVAECASRTVHMVQHVGWVPDGCGGYRGQIATLVRPKGRFGKLYMRAIAPFRRFIVSPALVRSIGRDWQADVRGRHRLREAGCGKIRSTSAAQAQHAPLRPGRPAHLGDPALLLRRRIVCEPSDTG